MQNIYIKFQNDKTTFNNNIFDGFGNIMDQYTYNYTYVPMKMSIYKKTKMFKNKNQVQVFFINLRRILLLKIIIIICFFYRKYDSACRCPG